MSDTSYVGLSHVRALQRQLDISANNIANANTAGFKGERPVFEATTPDTTKSSVTASSYVIDRGSYLDLRPGALTQTGNPLDVALSGTGWLSYETPEGQRAFGRDGALHLDQEGMLVTASGSRILDEGGAPIIIPPGAGEVGISSDGTVTVGGEALSRIGMFDVANVQSFQRLGNGMLVPPPGAEAETAQAEKTILTQGALEGSNVDPVREMTRLIEVQRAYERSNALLTQEDDLKRDALSRIGRSA